MFQDRHRPSLSDLFLVRTSLRQQEVLLLGALHDVQSELRSWEGHRLSRQAAGQAVPHELCILWEELAERERELAIDLVAIRSAVQTAQGNILRRLQPRPLAS